MNHLIALRFFLVSLLVAISTAMNAEEIEYTNDDGFRFSLKTETQTAELMGYSGQATSVAVPENVSYEGVVYPVESMGGGCFYYNQTIESVTIPSSVKTFGAYMFSGCISLKSVVLSPNTDCLGTQSFYNCISLESIEIPSSVKSLGFYCFGYCTSLKSIDIPSSVETIDEYCFTTCNSLTSISLPSYIKSLGNGCFWGCTALTTIEIPSLVETIGNYCFGNCSSLNSIVLPNTITSLGDYCFEGCSSLSSINLPCTIKTIGDYCFSQCSTLKEIELCSSVESMGKGCFSRCSSLTTVALPTQITCLDDNLFESCSSLKSIEIPSSVTSLGNHCFGGCKSLSSVKLPSGLISIGDLCFSNCRVLQSIDIPSSVESLGNTCFHNCYALKSIDIPSSVTALGIHTFSYCKSLKSIILPQNLTSLGEECFRNCQVLESIEIPSSVKSLGIYCFHNCYALKSIEIPSSVTTLGEGLFYYCKSLHSVILPQNTTCLGKKFFAYCQSLKSIEIPSSVESLGESCFDHCYSLESINIPTNVTSIGVNAFQYCPSLKTLTCQIPTALEGDFFYNCKLDMATLFVPKESIELYSSAEPWCDFGTILGIEDINQQELTGEIIFTTNDNVYRGVPLTPEWSFSNEDYTRLKEGQDYIVTWSDNIFPGKGCLTVKGINKYCGSLSAYFDIDKAQLSDNNFSLYLPSEDLTYDEQPHGATVSSEIGVGNATIFYLKQGETEVTTEAPSEPGEYTIYLEFSDGDFYYGRERYIIGSFTIYQFNADEWLILQTVLPQLTAMGWSQPWDVSQSMNSVSSLSGLIIEKGHVTGFDFSGQTLTGSFPYFLLSLPNLHKLNLANNQLSGDIGTSAYAFAQQNPLLTLALEEINVSGNQFTGNLGVFANCFANLKFLDASHNCLEDIYPLIPATVTSLDISSQTISRVVPLELSSLSIDDLETKIPSILLYDHANQKYKTDINFLCSTKENDWSIVLYSKDGQLGAVLVSEQNAYYGESGATLSVAVIDNFYGLEGSTFYISLGFDQGDGNFDGKVDVIDLQTTLNYMFGEYPYIFNFTAANLYKDEVVNVQDVISFVNMLLDQSASVASKAPRRAKKIPEAQSDLSLFIEDDNVYLSAQEPVAALHIVSQGGIEWDFKSYGLEQSYNSNGVVAYSLSGSTLPMGTIKIGKITTGEAAILTASASTPDATPLSISLTRSPATGINGVSIQNENGKTYSVDGVQRQCSIKGLRIEKRDNRYVKTINK